jgi:hypothetical protein
MYVPRPSQLIRGLNHTLLVNPDYTIMTLVPRDYQLVQAGVCLSPALIHSPILSASIRSLHRGLEREEEG